MENTYDRLLELIFALLFLRCGFDDLEIKVENLVFLIEGCFDVTSL